MNPILITIYLIGCIISYSIYRLYRHKDQKPCWEDIVLALFVSCFSYLGAFAMLFMYIMAKEDIKPPKWL